VHNNQRSKIEILKSTTLLGGSSLITILIGMVRTKIVAILLGPNGIGFMSVLTSLQQIVSTITGLGLNSSGIRQIAFSASTQDDKAISITVKSLRFTVWATGGLGFLVMVIGAKLFSQASFKTTEYALSIGFLGFAILFSAISSGQSSVLQGFRRIGDVAKINIIGAISGTIISLPCYYFWGINGIVPSLIVVSLAALGTSWWFARKVNLVQVPISYSIVKKESQKLIVFGLPLMLSALVASASNYIARVFLSREAGLDAVGQFQAAFSLAGVLVNFVLNAMGTDYYPRLTAVSEDNLKMNEEVNSQTEIALLLAVPMLAATVLFMPYAIHLFYSSRFDRAIPILRWALFGILGQVISWPMGYIMLAKAKGGWSFFTQVISYTINIILLVICYKLIGLPGAGLAFALLYVWHTGFMSIVAFKLSKFRWNKHNIKLIILSVLLVSTLSIIQIITITSMLKNIISAALFLFIIYVYLKKLLHITGLSFQEILGKLKKR